MKRSMTWSIPELADFGITYNHEIPVEDVMACELVPDALAKVHGEIDCF